VNEIDAASRKATCGHLFPSILSRPHLPKFSLAHLPPSAFQVAEMGTAMAMRLESYATAHTASFVGAAVVASAILWVVSAVC
jgi:hypothetical protein